MLCDALYLHIPFCLRKCPYCDFYSVGADPSLMDAYTRAVLDALAQVPFDLAPLDTVYFGGGTPSVLGGERLVRLLNGVRSRFGIRPDAEVTIECNPCSALPDTLARLWDAGANRLSLGMQSADDQQLARLGRMHTIASVRDAVDAAYRVGFSHLSLDLMLATPGQTLPDIDRAANLCAEVGAEHVSAYLLKIEPDTPFGREGAASRCPDEDGQADAYLHAVETLEQRGYQQYEISNFARDGRIARHNCKYWDCREYLGIGPSAHSFIGGRRRYFPRDLRGFLEAPDKFALLRDDGPGGDTEEYLMLRLRLTEGVAWDALASRFPGFDPTPLHEKARPLQKGGLLFCDEDGLRLTPSGFLLSNFVIGELLL